MYKYIFVISMIAAITVITGAEPNSDYDYEFESDALDVREISPLILFEIGTIKGWGVRVKSSDTLSTIITKLNNDLPLLINDRAPLEIIYSGKKLAFSANDNRNFLQSLCELTNCSSTTELLETLSNLPVQIVINQP